MTIVFRAAFPLLALLLLAYFLLAPLGVPVSAVTGGGALVLLVLAGRWHKAVGAPSFRHQGAARRSLANRGLLPRHVSRRLWAAECRADHHWPGLNWLAAHGLWVATIGTGFGAAIFSSVMNNMPSVLVGALAIEQAQHIPPVIRELMIYANVVGCDLGPKFTPIGSLATLLWLNVLSRKGISIGWGQYMKVGLMITPPVLLVVLIALAVWLHILGAA